MQAQDGIIVNVHGLVRLADVNEVKMHAHKENASFLALVKPLVSVVCQVRGLQGAM